MLWCSHGSRPYNILWSIVIRDDNYDVPFIDPLSCEGDAWVRSICLINIIIGMNIFMFIDLYHIMNIILREHIRWPWTSHLSSHEYEPSTWTSLGYKYYDRDRHVCIFSWVLIIFICSIISIMIFFKRWYFMRYKDSPEMMDDMGLIMSERNGDCDVHLYGP